MEVEIWMRAGLASAGELEAARRHFRVIEQRTSVSRGALVIGRYSVLPHYAEAASDVLAMGGCLANTIGEHRWIASLGWYEDLAAHTPRTWREDQLPFIDHPGPFVVKGATNSKKWQWETHMFAADRAAASRVCADLREDSLVGEQPLFIREYVPLRKHEDSVVGPPFAHEYRFFFWGTELLVSGYYWSPAEVTDLPVPPEAEVKARQCAEIAAQHATFFVLDVAQTESGDWILIEVNDGQQSGLSEVDPETLYSRLREAITRR